MEEQIVEVRKALAESGYFSSESPEDSEITASGRGPTIEGIRKALEAANDAQRDLLRISRMLHTGVVAPIIEAASSVEDPAWFDRVGGLLEEILSAVDDFQREQGFVKVYGELLSCYILVLYRRGSVGRESPIIRMILTNTARCKAAELNEAQLCGCADLLRGRVVVAITTKRYKTFVLAVRGVTVLFRAEIEFRTAGKSPAELALRIANLLVKHGVRLSDVTDVVCAGGDLGNVPDGIYVLSAKVRDESWKRLSNSSLNRGALVAWEFKKLLKARNNGAVVGASLVSPLSFSTIGEHEVGAFLKEESYELSRSLKGYVKVTPLKAISALISEIRKTRPETLNMLVMTLDELFASVVRKIGPRIVREMAAQNANNTLGKFDFEKITAALREEGFNIPPHFGLLSPEVGTGVGEICELLQIIGSGGISPSLAQSLTQVADTYAQRAAMILQMASAGPQDQRPHYLVITSMKALEPEFLHLFSKIRNRVEQPFSPVMVLDSLEHEYLIARHLFEVRLNPSEGESRLLFSEEERSMRNALQVLRSPRSQAQIFSFTELREEVIESIAAEKSAPGKIVLVGADNEDALLAVADARELGLLGRVVLIGDPRDIETAAERTKIPISSSMYPDVEILPTDPSAVDFEAKKRSMAHVFGEFLHRHRDFMIMKGSLSTAPLLHQALSIYNPDPGSGAGDSRGTRRTASHTALFVLPDGRLIALSDAAINPSFADADKLVTVMENQIEVVRRVVGPEETLKLAIITAVEKETAAIPATFLAAHAEEKSGRLVEKYGPLIVEGPLSFDLATVPEAAEEKHYEGLIRGDANCLVATDINTANVLYKTLSKTMGSLGIFIENGSVVTAGPGSAPIVLTSRGDTSRTKFNSILLAFTYASMRNGTGGDHSAVD
jgi:phosphate butyryltransferase